MDAKILAFLILAIAKAGLLVYTGILRAVGFRVAKYHVGDSVFVEVDFHARRRT